MTTWNDRLKRAMSEGGVSSAQLARAVGVSTATVSDWVNGVIRELKAIHSEKICAALGISHRWLILGKGQMKTDSTGVAEAHAEDGLSPRLVEIIRRLDRDHLKKLEEIAELYALQKDMQK